jgi:hypothetical protein
MGDDGARGLKADLGHGPAEAFSVLGHIDGLLRSPDHLYPKARQYALTHQIQGTV